MNRRAFLVGLGAVLAAPRAAPAQQAGKLWRIGRTSRSTTHSVSTTNVVAHLARESKAPRS
jgi:hypothetical protein